MSTLCPQTHQHWPPAQKSSIHTPPHPPVSTRICVPSCLLRVSLSRLVCLLLGLRFSLTNRRQQLDCGCGYLEERDRDVDVLRDGPHHHPPVRVLDARLPAVELHNNQPSQTGARQRASHSSVVFRRLPWSTCVCSSWSTPPSACLVACGGAQTRFNRLSSSLAEAL